MKLAIAVSAFADAGSAAFADFGPVRRYITYIPAAPITMIANNISTL